MDTVLAIIITYNAEKYIENCLKEIINIPRLSIFIVDNNSTDKTLEILKKYSQNIRIVSNKLNVGFGQANNIGLAYALVNGFEYVLLLNQDTSIDVATIQKIIDVHKNNLQYGILTPFHYFTDDILQKSFSNHILANPNLIKDIETNSLSSIVYEVPFINAAIWLLHRSTIEKIGGFSPIFFHYGEDDNYCHRMQYFGLKVGVVPSLKAYHYSLDRHSQYYKGKEKELIINQLRLKISNPNNRYNHYTYLSSLIVKMLLNFVIGKSSYKNHYQNLKASLKLDLAKIKKMKKQSTKKSIPFLQV